MPSVPIPTHIAKILFDEASGSRQHHGPRAARSRFDGRLRRRSQRAKNNI